MINITMILIIKPNIKQIIIVISKVINKCNKLYKKKYRNDISIELYNLDNYIMLNTNKDIEDDLNFYYLINTLKYEERMEIMK